MKGPIPAKCRLTFALVSDFAAVNAAVMPKMKLSVFPSGNHFKSFDSRSTAGFEKIHSQAKPDTSSADGAETALPFCPGSPVTGQALI